MQNAIGAVSNRDRAGFGDREADVGGEFIDGLWQLDCSDSIVDIARLGYGCRVLVSFPVAFKVEQDLRCGHRSRLSMAARWIPPRQPQNPLRVQASKDFPLCVVQ